MLNNNQCNNIRWCRHFVRGMHDCALGISPVTSFSGVKRHSMVLFNGWLFYSHALGSPVRYNPSAKRFKAAGGGGPCHTHV